MNIFELNEKREALIRKQSRDDQSRQAVVELIARNEALLKHLILLSLESTPNHALALEIAKDEVIAEITKGALHSMVSDVILRHLEDQINEKE